MLAVDTPTKNSELTELAVSFRRSLRAANRSENTIKAYLDAVSLLDQHLANIGHTRQLQEVRRGDVEGFINNLLDRLSAATAATRFRGLQQFFKWALEEGEIASSLMVGMKQPKIPQKDVPVIPQDALRRLLKACAGPDFLDRRDSAIISCARHRCTRRRDRRPRHRRCRPRRR